MKKCPNCMRELEFYDHSISESAMKFCSYCGAILEIEMMNPEEVLVSKAEMPEESQTVRRLSKSVTGRGIATALGIVIVVFATVTFAITEFRYEYDQVDQWPLKYDRITSTVYIKDVTGTNEWIRTNAPNIPYAKAVIQSKYLAELEKQKAKKQQAQKKAKLLDDHLEKWLLNKVFPLTTIIPCNNLITIIPSNNNFNKKWMPIMLLARQSGSINFKIIVIWRSGRLL